MSNKKKNIVILSTMYHPDMGAPSACVDKYVQALKDKYNFYIITKTYKTDIVPDGKYKIRYISSFIHRVILKCNKNIDESRFIWLNKIVLFCCNIYKLIATQFCYPTSGRWEITEYYRGLKKLSEEIEINTVIAVSNTFFPQFSVSRFKETYQNINYIAFIYDPFSENYVYYQYKLFKKWWKQKNRKNEELIYQKADTIFFSEEMYRFALNNFKFNLAKTHCLYFPLSDIRKNQHHVDNSPLIRLIYAGALYKKIRNPEFMLFIMSQVNGIRLDLFVNKGECEDIIEKYTSNVITRDYFVDRDRYDEMICNEYDILVNIGNISTLQAPSKMLELLSTGRPILNFYFAKDNQYQMIEKYPLGLNIGYHEENAVEKVTKFCHRVKGHILSFEEVSALYPENALGNQVKLLETLING